MATEDDGKAPYKSHGYGDKSRNRPFRPEINEEPQNDLQEAGRNNSTGVSDEGGNSANISAATGISELERMLKQMTFTRSEIQHLTALLHSEPGHSYRTIEIIGSVDGLICPCYGDDVIQIWNPSLSAVSTLPPYSFPYCSCFEIHFRFGFDPNTNDYKVIKITGVIQPLETSSEEDPVPIFYMSSKSGCRLRFTA